MDKLGTLLYISISILLIAVSLIQIQMWYNIHRVPNFHIGSYDIIAIEVDRPPPGEIAVFKNGILEDKLSSHNMQVNILIGNGDVLEIDARDNTGVCNLSIDHVIDEMSTDILPTTIVIETGLYRFSPFYKKTL